MKKRWLVVCLILMTFVVCLFAGCSGLDVNFGAFCQSGNYLIQIAKNDISYSDALSKVVANSLYNAPSNYAVSLADDAKKEVPSISEELVKSVVQKYSELQIVVKYYDEEDKFKEESTPAVLGTKLTDCLTNNYIETSLGLRVSNLVIFDGLINYMGDKNEEFSQDESNINVPFTAPYTFHTDSDKNLVLQMHMFTEIDGLDISGGINCSYRQDTEVLYDSENKISKWQTSLGVWIAGVKGAVRQGYIYEVEFNWIAKV